jgi:hypothetical protein
MAVPDKPGPGPLPAVVGGVVAALVLLWLVSAVIGTIVFVTKVILVAGVVIAGFWVWGKLRRD